MIVAPSSGQGSVVEVPVALFSYETDHKILALAKSYQDMIEMTRHSFGLQNQDIVLCTTTLNVCRDMRVQIGESAYPFLLSVLQHVEVVVLDSKSPSSSGKEATSVKGPESSDSEEFEELEVEAPPSSPAPAEPKGKHVAPEANAAVATISSKAVKPDSKRPKAEKPSSVAPKSEKPVSRPTALSEAKIPPPPHFPSESKHDTAPAPKFRAMRPKQSTASLTQAPRTRPTEGRERQASLDPAPQQPVRTGANDERLKVHITTADGQESEFKTRGGHLIKKVHAGACKTFGLDPTEYHIAKIERYLDGEDEVEDLVWLDLELTVAQHGLVDGERLALETKNENDISDEEAE